MLRRDRLGTESAYPRAAWDACHRADWLIWIASRAGASDSALRVAACACARTALRHIPADEERPLRAIETAERFARDAASQSELDAARAAAGAATWATGAARGATGAARAATWAARAATWAAEAAAADAGAARAATGAARGAARAATGAARAATGAARGAAADAGAFEAAALAEMAALVRSAIPYEELVL